MQTLMTLHALAADPHLHVLADGNPVPNYTPTLPKEVNSPVKTILGWTAGIGLAGAVLGGLVAWSLVAVGHNTERAQLAARGKQGVLWSLVGAGGIGVTASLVYAFYDMAN